MSLPVGSCSPVIPSSHADVVHASWHCVACHIHAFGYEFASDTQQVLSSVGLVLLIFVSCRANPVQPCRLLLHALQGAFGDTAGKPPVSH